MPVPDLSGEEIARLAARYRDASGPMMSLVNMVGSRVEKQIEALPDGVKDRIETIVERALHQAYGMAGRTLSGRASNAAATAERRHRAAALVTGAVGGMGGLASSLAELPVTVTLIFRAIQKIAASYGYDPEDEAVRLECLQVFAAGSPLAEDDGVNTSFLGARVTITGPALNRVVAAVAPRLSVALGEKLAAQAVPLLGAVAGASINYAFLRYYQEMAHVRFGLRRLEDRGHDRAQLVVAFRAAAATPKRRAG
ncbi:EcsC family protein [Acidimangrovimonas sediminis]|uniref:EcsC family protein n=1 Tax=Acidimangrovimonas sediminis TaxID=2056283 RepID=UPI001E29C550|nr:EcsC family protein [Acidimangrovimonas sediminis]